MNCHTLLKWPAVPRTVYRGLLSLLLVFMIVAGLVAGATLAAPQQSPGRVQAMSPPVQPDRAGLALFVIHLDEPTRLAEAKAAGLQLYSQFSSKDGDYLLVGAAAEAAGHLGGRLRLLDEDTTGANYYLAHPRAGAGAVRWDDHGRVVLDLGDQVLLRSRPELAERLPELGVEIAAISLEPQPWPTQQVGASALLAITPDPNVQTMLSQVSTDTIYSYTAQLTGAQSATIGGSPYTITRRYTYSGTPIQKAGQFAGEHLQGLGLNVEYHVWGTSGTPSTYPNVIGQITGSTNPGDIYIIGAHLDDVPTSGTAPGADDNASGSVGTLIAADILSQYQWSCTLRFAFWTGEEQGLYGSAAYATRAKNAGENIKGYLNMDMISYNSGAPNEINLFSKSSVAGSVDMMNLYADAISAYGLNLVPVKYPDDTMGNYSDNKSFWDKGYASILAIEDYYGDETPYYHTSGDTLSTLDMAYYTNFVKASLATFVHLSGCLITGPTPTPTETVVPTETPIPTETPTPTQTPIPTETPIPTATATPLPVPPILLVDDDAGSSYQTYFAAALAALGRTYDTWTVASSGSPSAATLQAHQIVIWLTGNDYSTTLTTTDITNLTTYLNGGGKLFITGQDIGYDISTNAFFSNYLHATYIADDTNVTTLTGTDIMAGANVTITGGDGASNQTYPSAIGLGTGAVGLYDYTGTTYTWGALRYEGTYRLVYFAFGFEGISAAATRATVMGRVLSFLESGVTPTATPTDTPLPTHTPTPTNAVVPTETPILTETLVPTQTPLPTDTPIPTETSVPTQTPTSAPTNTPLPGARLYLGSSTAGTAGGISFADEDILIKDMGTGAWSLFVDGSDTGLTNTDMDAFDLQADGTLLMSFDTGFTLSGFGAVDDSDILRFTPTSTGDTTAGTWSWYFDGSDVGLSTSDEDVDALDVLPDGRVLISTLGNVSVTGASGADEDLLAFTPTALGSTTGGTWAMYFDGSDVGLSSTSNEDVNGLWVDAAGKIYLTTLGSFSVTGVSGDGSDIFVCTPGTLGSTTTCTWAMYWHGSVNGFSGEDTDSISMVP